MIALIFVVAFSAIALGFTVAAVRSMLRLRKARSHKALLGGWMHIISNLSWAGMMWGLSFLAYAVYLYTQGEDNGWTVYPMIVLMWGGILGFIPSLLVRWRMKRAQWDDEYMWGQIDPPERS